MPGLAVALQYVLAGVLLLTGIALAFATLRGPGFANMLDGHAMGRRDTGSQRTVPLPSTEAALSPAQGSPRIEQS